MKPSRPSDEKSDRTILQSGRFTWNFAHKLIGRDDYARLAEFDALFIRETTSVNTHLSLCPTRSQRRSDRDDDPLSIVKCSNKVYLAELMARQKILTPRTLVVHKDNWQSVQTSLYPFSAQEAR